MEIFLVLLSNISVTLITSRRYFLSDAGGDGGGGGCVGEVIGTGLSPLSSAVTTGVIAAGLRPSATWVMATGFNPFSKSTVIGF